MTSLQTRFDATARLLDGVEQHIREVERIEADETPWLVRWMRSDQVEKRWDEKLTQAKAKLFQARQQLGGDVETARRFAKEAFRILQRGTLALHQRETAEIKSGERIVHGGFVIGSSLFVLGTAGAATAYVGAGAATLYGAASAGGALTIMASTTGAGATGGYAAGMLLKGIEAVVTETPYHYSPAEQFHFALQGGAIGLLQGSFPFAIRTGAAWENAYVWGVPRTLSQAATKAALRFAPASLTQGAVTATQSSLLGGDAADIGVAAGIGIGMPLAYAGLSRFMKLPHDLKVKTWPDKLDPQSRIIFYQGSERPWQIASYPVPFRWRFLPRPPSPARGALPALPHSPAGINPYLPAAVRMPPKAFHAPAHLNGFFSGFGVEMSGRLGKGKDGGAVMNVSGGMGGAAGGSGGDGPKKGGRAPSPYESRYRAVQKAGGERFYPKVPSEELVHFLDKQQLAPGSALVAGCGEGRNIGPLTGKGWRVLGIDSAPSGLKIARRDHAHQSNVTFLEADLLQPISVKSNSTDLVVAVGFLHMILSPADRQHFYREMHRVMRPGGWIFFENNGRYAAETVEYLPKIAGELRTIQTSSGPRKIRLDRLPTVMLNAATIRQELEDAGFQIVEIKPGSFQHPDTLRDQIIVYARKKGS